MVVQQCPPTAQAWERRMRDLRDRRTTEGLELLATLAPGFGTQVAHGTVVVQLLVGDDLSPEDDPLDIAL